MAGNSNRERAQEAQRTAQALFDLQTFTARITDILKKHRPADIRDLLHPGRIKDAYPNVTIGYFDFPTWLTRFDPTLIRPLDVNIHSYRYQRDKQAQDVELELIKIRMTSTGIALMREAEATGQKLSILPYWDFTLFPSPLFPARGFNALILPGGPGQPGLPGTNAIILFLPQMWGPKGTSGISGPGSNSDEILFHEMIHATRQMRGVFKQPPPGQEYTPEEEDLAVALTNIYLAEKKQKALRTSNQEFIPLPHPEAFLGNPASVRLLQEFHGQQSSFFDALAAILQDKAWWNPIRDL
jgi:hypothetical protein